MIEFSQFLQSFFGASVSSSASSKENSVFSSVDASLADEFSLALDAQLFTELDGVTEGIEQDGSASAAEQLFETLQGALPAESLPEWSQLTSAEKAEWQIMMSQVADDVAKHPDKYEALSAAGSSIAHTNRSSAGSLLASKPPVTWVAQMAQHIHGLVQESQAEGSLDSLSNASSEDPLLVVDSADSTEPSSDVDDEATSAQLKTSQADKAKTPSVERANPSAVQHANTNARFHVHASYVNTPSQGTEVSKLEHTHPVARYKHFDSSETDFEPSTEQNGATAQQPMMDSMGLGDNGTLTEGDSVLNASASDASVLSGSVNTAASSVQSVALPDTSHVPEHAAWQAQVASSVSAQSSHVIKGQNQTPNHYVQTQATSEETLALDTSFQQDALNVDKGEDFNRIIAPPAQMKESSVALQHGFGLQVAPWKHAPSLSFSGAGTSLFSQASNDFNPDITNNIPVTAVEDAELATSWSSRSSSVLQSLPLSESASVDTSKAGGQPSALVTDDMFEMSFSEKDSVTSQTPFMDVDTVATHMQKASVMVGREGESSPIDPHFDVSARSESGNSHINSSSLIAPGLVNAVSQVSLQGATHAKALSSDAVIDKAVAHQAVQGTLTTLESGRTEMTLQLAPEHLGEMEIQLVSHGDQTVQAIFKVSSPEALESLKSQVDSMKQTLESQSVRMDNIQIVLAGSSEAAMQHGQQHSSQGFAKPDALFDSSANQSQTGDSSQGFQQAFDHSMGQSLGNPQFGSGQSAHRHGVTTQSADGVTSLQTEDNASDQMAQSPSNSRVYTTDAAGNKRVSVLV